ncbi:MAG TPA: HAD family phosphatase [Candidatus Pristimantibacillus sp.]|nr:HAD family phosphatase [Candidatus Pristimantibacillus sp.]
MLKFADIAGAIFDVDDTLLDNQPPGESVGLHERSRLLATHEVGKRHNLPALQAFTAEQAREAFLNAKVHNLDSTVWQMLVIAGEVSEDEEMDPLNPLLREIAELKEDLHEHILRTRGKEVPDATRFVELLAGQGLSGKLAVASTSGRRDIEVFFEMTGLGRFFPEDKIISREDLTHAKPHPEAFNMAFARLGVPEKLRGSVIAFEDDPRGVMAAKAAGLYTCAITTRVSREEMARLAVPPDLVADSFAEFAKLFDLPDTLNI